MPHRPYPFPKDKDPSFAERLRLMDLGDIPAAKKGQTLERRLEAIERWLGAGMVGLEDCLSLLGWDRPELARQLGIPAKTPQRWGDEDWQRGYPPEIMPWMRRLIAFRLIHLAPESWRARERGMPQPGDERAKVSWQKEPWERFSGES